MSKLPSVLRYHMFTTVQKCYLALGSILLLNIHTFIWAGEWHCNLIMLMIFLMCGTWESPFPSFLEVDFFSSLHIRNVCLLKDFPEIGGMTSIHPAPQTMWALRKQIIYFGEIVEGVCKTYCSEFVIHNFLGFAEFSHSDNQRVFRGHHTYCYISFYVCCCVKLPSKDNNIVTDALCITQGISTNRKDKLSEETRDSCHCFLCKINELSLHFMRPLRKKRLLAHKPASVTVHLPWA